MKLLAGFVPIMLLSFNSTHAQDRSPSLLVSRTNAPIRIDGAADEAAWQAAVTTAPFFNKWPLDSGYAAGQTEVKMMFDDQFIYVYAKNYQKRSDVIIQTLKRDQIDPLWGGDAFAIVLDPIRQKTNGFLFALNAGGAQVEASINLMGSWARANENWDYKWFSAVQVHDDYWTAEMAIPFNALRFDDESREWGLNFVRGDMKRNIFSTWSHVPLQFNGLDLGHLGTLQWNEKITPVKSRIIMIPYISGGETKNHEEGEPGTTSGNAGVDMKVALTSSLNADITFRPDFSNVDVDQQMTNVTRFSLLYPERRNFFLENADLFSNFGSWLTRPFFSRRIGLHEGTPIPILAGARLSGNVTPGLRVGIMDIQTEATGDFSANNYLVTSFQQRVLARSSFKFFGASRQTTRVIEGDTQPDYNRTYGGEFQYVSSNGNWNGYVRAHSSLTPEKYNDNNYFSGQLNYMNRKFYAGVLVDRVGENYINDLGFIPRLYNYDASRDSTVRIGHYAVNPWLGVVIYPKKSKKINSIEPNTWSVVNYRTDGSFLERNTSLSLTIQFKNTRVFYVEAFNTSVQLPFASDIIDSGNPLPATRYDFTQYTLRYTTDSRKALNGDFRLGYGGFYNGSRFEYGATLNLRKQPWGTFGVSYLQNDIELGGEYGTARFILLGPKAEVSLRNNMWWTTFLQYNTQQNNFNVNSRFQWRYKPMSDVFIVYTDNYVCDNLKVKNRGVVFKLTYWLNL